MQSLPSESKCSKFTSNEARPYVQNLVLELRKYKTNKKIMPDLLKRLTKSYIDYYKFIEDIVTVLIRERFIDLLLEIYENNPENDIIERLFYILINYTDASGKFSNAVANNVLIQKLIENIVKDFEGKYLLKLLKIVNNVLRDPNNRVSHKIGELKCFLVERSSDHDEIAILSLLILSYIVDDDKKDILSTGHNVVIRLIHNLQCINNSDRRYAGYTAQEILNGLRCISANDSMKEEILKENGIEIILRILEYHINKDAGTGKKYDELEVEFALETLIQLSFLPKVQVLLKEQKLLNILKPFENHKNEKIRKCFEGLKWNITEKTMSNEVRNDKPDSKFDVFISYSWSNKKIILNICNHLKKNSNKVWIDEEQIYGSTLDSMAKGIENSSVIIIAASESYRRSYNCRLEAEYATRLHKKIVPLIMERKYKPSGWLALILGVTFYIEFSPSEDTEENIKKHERNINKLLDTISKVKLGDEDFDELSANSGERNARIYVSSNSSKIREDVKAWTPQQIVKWLKEFELERFYQQFNIDGSLLTVMADIRIQSPEYFNSTLKAEFGMNFIEVLKFHKALNSIFQ